MNTSTPSDPVAVRYKSKSDGRWRYLNFPFTKGWTFPESLGTPEPLYAAPVHSEAVSGAVMLTEDEKTALFENHADGCDGDQWDRLIQRAFAKKNGLAIKDLS